MSDTAVQPERDDSTQPEKNASPDVKENPVGKMSAVNIGEQIHENTKPPSENMNQNESSDSPTPSPTPSNEESFNPSIHEVDSNGQPALTADGSFRKKRGRKAKQQNGTQNNPQTTAEVIDDFNSPPPPSTIQFVGFALGMFCAMTSKMIGPEWKPSPDEQTMLHDVWSRYVHYKKWDEAMTPEVVVVSVTMAYLVPRIMHPNFMAIIKRKKNAHSNNRTTGNGQNNVSQNNSGASREEKPQDSGVRPVGERVDEFRDDVKFSG